MKGKSLFTNAFWNISANLFSMLILFILAPFLITRLGESQYGMYILLVSVSSFLGIMNLGLGEATLRYVAFYFGREDLEGVRRVFQATLFVYAISGALSFLILFFGAPFLVNLFKLQLAEKNLANSLFKLTAIAFFVRFISGPIGAVSQGLLRYDIYSKINIIENILRIIGSILFILLGFGLSGLMILNIILSLFCLVTNMVLTKKLVPSISFLPVTSKSALKEVFGYGIFAFLSQIFGIIWQNADRMILGALIGTSAIAFFAVPQDLAFRALGLAAAGGAVLLPKFSSIHNQDELNKLFTRSTLIFLILTAIVFVPISVVIKDFLRLWVSPEFASKCGFVGTILAVSCIIRGAFVPNESLFRGIGKPQYYLILVILTSSTIIISDLILIPRFGFAGAGYSFCISPIWGIIAVCISWRYILKNRELMGLVKFFLVPLILCVFSLAIAFFVRSVFPSEIGWLPLITVAFSTAILTGIIMGGYEVVAFGKESSVKDIVCRLVNETKKHWRFS